MTPLPTHPESLPRHSCGKLRYPDKRAAQTALNKRLTGHGGHGRPDRLHIYTCPNCHGWHLGKN